VVGSAVALLKIPEPLADHIPVVVPPVTVPVRATQQVFEQITEDEMVATVGCFVMVKESVEVLLGQTLLLEAVTVSVTVPRLMSAADIA
jgi:hypothetical protein